MLLILARHGNTFHTGEKAVWVGARTDLPLTPEGEEQASALGRMFRASDLRMVAVTAGPLKRTLRHAVIAMETAGIEGSPLIDTRLREIDYGSWEGLSSDEIDAAGGGDELRAWDKRGTWPRAPGWTPSRDAIIESVQGLASDLLAQGGETDAALLVTSNGILRFFLNLVPGAFEDMAAKGALKVATGHCCVLRFVDGRWIVMLWNMNPTRLLEVMVRL